MISIIIKKELFSHLQETRIQILTVTMLALTLIVTLLGIFQYKGQVERYQVDQRANMESIRNNLVYGTVKPKSIRQPESLSILCKGVDADFGNMVTFDLLNIPYEAEKAPGSNPYSSEFINLDVAKILIWLLSLIGLLISFDLISREKEEGTLKLILSNRVSRVRFLWSKFLSATISMIIILISVFLLILVIFLITPWITITASVLMSLFEFFIASLLYVLLWIALGMLISLIAGNSSTSLITSLAAWVIWMIVLPAAIKMIVGPTHFNQEKKQVRMLHNEIMSEYGNKHWEIYSKTVWPLISNLKFSTYGGGPDNPPIFLPNRDTFREIKKLQNTLNPLKMEFADRKYRVAEAHFLNPYRDKVHLHSQLAYLSPASLMETMMMRIAETSHDTYFRFLQQTIHYRSEVIQYFQSKNVFNSYRWFSVEPTPFGPEHPIFPKDPENPTPIEQKRVWDYLTKLEDDPQYRLNTEDFPLFQYKVRGIVDNLYDAFGFFLLLVTGTAILLLVCFLKVERYRIHN